MYFKQIKLSLLKGIFFLALALLSVQNGYSAVSDKNSKVNNKIEEIFTHFKNI